MAYLTAEKEPHLIVCETCEVHKSGRNKLK